MSNSLSAKKRLPPILKYSLTSGLSRNGVKKEKHRTKNLSGRSLPFFPRIKGTPALLSPLPLSSPLFPFLFSRRRLSPFPSVPSAESREQELFRSSPQREEGGPPLFGRSAFRSRILANFHRSEDRGTSHGRRRKRKRERECKKGTFEEKCRTFGGEEKSSLLI